MPSMSSSALNAASWRSRKSERKAILAGKSLSIQVELSSPAWSVRAGPMIRPSRTSSESSRRLIRYLDPATPGEAQRLAASSVRRKDGAGEATKLSAASINRPLALLRHLLRLAHEEWEEL